MPKLSLKSGVVIALIVLSFAVNGVIIMYSLWRGEFAQTLDQASEIAQTAKGPIEYVGLGNVVTEKNHLLILHGTPGGHDAGTTLADWLVLDNDIHAIVPSRPGYLRTPISVAQTPVETADAMVALLDFLKIEKATILGWSGGGPSALAMAERYPNRVEGLVLLSARVKLDNSYQFNVDHPPTRFNPDLVAVDYSFWGSDLKEYCKQLGFKLLPDWFFERFFPVQISHMELTIERLAQLSSATMPPSRREMGRQNDYFNFASLAENPDFNIKVPTLIIHSPMDEMVGMEHAEYAAASIDNAELFIVDNESHFSTMNAGAVGQFHVFLEKLRK